MDQKQYSEKSDRLAGIRRNFDAKIAELRQKRRQVINDFLKKADAKKIEKMRKELGLK